MNEININQISYKKKLILNECKVKILSKGICIIKGSNGSGKTSLAKQLVKSNQEYISYMMQSNETLINELSVLKNISFNQHTFNKIKKVLALLNLEYLINTTAVDKLSGGEKRIVNLLRCLLSDAPIIILDEPTNDLDKETIIKIKKLISYIAQEKYVIIITHTTSFEGYYYMYAIQDNNLVLIERRDNALKRDVSLKKCKLNPFYQSKANYILVVFPLLFFMFVFFSIYNFNLEKFSSSTNNNMILLETYSSTYADPSESFDTSLITCLNVKDTKKCLENNLVEKERKLTSKININFDNEYYVVEFYDKKNKQYFNVRDSIDEELSDNFKYNIKYKNTLELMLEKNEKNIVLIPNDFSDKQYLDKLKSMGFTIKNHGNNDILVTFNKTFYKEYSKKYDALDKVSLLINNNQNLNFVDFIMKNNLDKTVLLLKSKDSEKLFYELNQLVSIKTFIKSIIIPFILVYISVIIIVLYLEVANMKRNRILYYYGFNKKEIYNDTIDKYRFVIHDAFVLILGLLIAVFAYIKFENYLLTITCLLIMISSLLLTRLLRFLIKVNLRRVVR